MAEHIGNVNWRARKIDALSYFSLRRTHQRNVTMPFVIGLCLHAADHVHVHANNVYTHRLEMTCIFVFPYVTHKRMEITASSCDTLLYILCAKGIFLYPHFFFLKVFNLVNVFRNFHIRIQRKNKISCNFYIAITIYVCRIWTQHYYKNILLKNVSSISLRDLRITRYNRMKYDRKNVVGLTRSQ